MLARANWQLERIREGEDCLGTWTAGFYSSTAPVSVKQVAQPLAREVVCRAWAGVAAGAQCPGWRHCGAGTSAHVNVSAEIK